MAAFGSSLISVAISWPSWLLIWRMAGGKVSGFCSTSNTAGARSVGAVVGGFAGSMRADDVCALPDGLVAGPAVWARSQPISSPANMRIETLRMTSSLQSRWTQYTINPMSRIAPVVPAETDILCEGCGYTLNGLP